MPSLISEKPSLMDVKRFLLKGKSRFRRFILRKLPRRTNSKKTFEKGLAELNKRIYEIKDAKLRDEQSAKNTALRNRFVGAAMCGLYSGADRQNDIDISKIKIRLTYNSTEMLIFYMNHWLLFLMHPSLRVFLEFYVMLPFLRDIPTLI